MTAAQRERAAIVETFEQVGPDVPTLCEGWTARDLAAHLVVRERRFDAAAGILLPPLSGYTKKVQRRVAGSDWNELVDKVASGPPVYSPFKLLDPLVNTTELFIHHEDLRRAQPTWEPRDLDPALAAALRRPLPLMTRMILSKSPARVRLQTPDGETLATVGRGPDVTVTGAPEELLLFLFGRDGAARVEFGGDPELVGEVKAARQSL
ncbi:TIGR03085 family metal-binding protein [Mycobacterium sp. MYCO198283]|uniref:TIGR03085 family metal-binding protein n=1 Tax=Mycobacterium sp. MYCO198283 TaxID=2883505 RepID=UPI001E56BFFD|nr:TIGR03085 family metal-binding protein [Mycobacterium sp. MYCO198283]MCG5432121.1 TIGR03085 family metal-binding protein [Mycobacterium sp. MYCO198283]